MCSDRLTGQQNASDSTSDDEGWFVPKRPASGLRDHLWFVAKLGVTALLFWAIFRNVDPSPVLARLAGLNIGLLLLALGIISLQIGLAAVRWGYILQVAGAPLATPLLIRFMMIGQFFNQAMVSTIGGDVVRVWLAGKAGGSYRGAAIGVLADRGFGVFTLLLLVAAAWPLQRQFFATAALGPVGFVLVAAGIAGFLGLAAFGAPLSRLFRGWRPVRPLGTLALLLGRVLGRAGMACGVLGISLLIHALSLLAMKILAQALGLDIPFLALAGVVPLVLLLSIIPITVGGWGLRESLMITGLGFVGVPSADGLALSVLFGLGLTAVGIPGGLLWLRGRRHLSLNEDRP